MDDWEHPQISRSRSHECSYYIHYSADGNSDTFSLVAKRSAKLTTPMIMRIDSELLATHSPTSGWKNDTAPATVVMKPSAAVLDLNMDFILVVV